MEREAIVWLALFVILLIVELLTVGLGCFPFDYETYLT